MMFAKAALVAVVSLSAQAFAGGACFYEHDNFQGRSFCIREGDQTRSVNHEFGMNDKISSIRVDRGVSVELYEHDNYAGGRINVDSTIYSMPGGWNDKVSSIVVESDYRGGHGRDEDYGRGRDDYSRGRDDYGRGRDDRRDDRRRDRGHGRRGR